jgi:hypothetical protein
MPLHLPKQEQYLAMILQLLFLTLTILMTKIVTSQLAGRIAAGC